MLVYDLQEWPQLFFWSCGLIFLVVVLLRGLTNKEIQKKRIKIQEPEKVELKSNEEEEEEV